MSIRIVQLGTPRAPSEGVRIGTVRRPPRGVPKVRFAADDWYDVWFPNLAPSPGLLKVGLSARSETEWEQFEKGYRKEMAQPGPKHDVELLAALSHTSDFSVGCYCADETRCHRSVLRRLLQENGAKLE